MWTPTFHRFASRAAFLAACTGAGWPTEGNRPIPPAGVEIDEIGPLLAPPAIVDGLAQPAEVIDARHHVNAAWHGVEPPDSFAAAAVTPDAPGRAFALPPPPDPVPDPVPASVPGWKGRATLQEAGFLAQAETVAEAAGPRVVRALAEADTWTRDSAFVAALATGLGLSSAEVDQLFRDADAIRS
jgi:hypothetical protein